MKKLLLTVIGVMCALCLGMGLIACNDDTQGGEPDGKITYTITLVAPDSDVTTLAVAEVKLQDRAGEEDMTEFKPFNGKGVATFSLPASTYKVVLNNIPSKYKVTDTFVTATAPAQTITLSEKGAEQDKETVDYTVKLTLPDGTAVANTEVQLCGGPNGACHVATTNAQGIATFKLEPYQYELHVEQVNCPTGYTFNNSLYTVSASTTSITAKFDAQFELTITVKYAAGKDSTGAAIAERPAQGITVRLNRMTSETQYLPTAIEGTTDATGVAKIAAAEANYRVTLANVPTGYTYLNAGAVIEKESPAMTITLMEIGSNENVRIKFDAGEDVTVNIDAAHTEYWYEFDPKGAAGYYILESTGTLDTYAHRYEGASGTIIYKNTDILTGTTTIVPPIVGANDRQDKSSTDKNFHLEFGLAPIYLDGSNIFAFLLGAQNLPSPVTPATFTFKVTLDREIVDDPQKPYVYVQPTQLIDPTAPPAGTITPVPYDDSSVVYNEEDGRFHVGTATGPVIYVAVAGSDNLPKGFDVNLYAAYLEAGGVGFCMETATQVKDYGAFLQKYGEKANTDGLHPLTAEMKDFLQAYATLNHNTEADMLPGFTYDTTKNMFVFACYYYQV